MRIQQSAELIGSHDQPRLVPTSGCANCSSPCGSGLWSADPSTMQSPSDADRSSLPVVVAMEAAAFNRYVALVFGLPLVGLFVMAAVFGFDPTSSRVFTTAQLFMSLLSVALLLLVVTTVCRSVAHRFESKLKLEIRQQNPHKT